MAMKMIDSHWIMLFVKLVDLNLEGLDTTGEDRENVARHMVDLMETHGLSRWQQVAMLYQVGKRTFRGKEFIDGHERIAGSTITCG